MSILDKSILTTVKKMLGPEEDYTYFDSDIIVHINAALERLRTLGIGPQSSFIITGAEETWADFFGDAKVIEMAPSYVYLYVKMLFDAPSSSIAAESFKSQIDKYEWLMNVRAEEDD